MKYREIDRLKLPSCKNEAIGERYYCCICGGKKKIEISLYSLSMLFGQVFSKRRGK